MAEDKKQIELLSVHFQNAVNIGGTVVTGAIAKLHNVVIHRIDLGVTISKPGWPKKMVPWANVKWVEFSD